MDSDIVRGGEGGYGVEKRERKSIRRADRLPLKEGNDLTFKVESLYNHRSPRPYSLIKRHLYRQNRYQTNRQ